MESIHAILLRSQLWWAGHVHRMDNCRLPKRLLYGELCAGKRSFGRPKKRYKDALKESLKYCNIPHSIWEETAEDRPIWRSLIRSGVSDSERRIRDKEQRRQKRKDRESSTSQPGSTPNIPCPHCNRHFRAKIGLISHLRTHPTPQ